MRDGEAGSRDGHLSGASRGVRAPLREGLLVRAVLGFLKAYKAVVSPLLPPACRFEPTCSEYAREAIGRYGIGRGSLLALGRLCRCQPFSAGGFDPVR